MLWVLLALTGAVANAAFYIIIKKYGTVLDPQIVTAVGFIFCSGLLFFISALQGFPALGPDYWPAVLISATINIICLILIFSALSSSDLSLAMPMLSFTPAFLIGISSLLLHEVPSLSGICGILIIVSGSYVLNISSEHEHILDPVRSMFRSRGSWYMLIVAFLFAVSINFDKMALLNSDPVFGMAFTLLFISGGFIGIGAIAPLSAFVRGDRGAADPAAPGAGPDRTVRQPSRLRPYLLPAILVAVFAAIEAVSINLAYTQQIVPYVIAIKRLGIIFLVLYGTMVCHEKVLMIRILGSALMVGGAAAILLFA
ncbi:MAG: DMT family transporter [Methanoregula sp.]|nr:DMT family transporter [Methanoregula sp.]